MAIPLGVALYVFARIVKACEKLIAPMATKLGIDRLLGDLTLLILTVLLLLLVIYALGLLMGIGVVAVFGKSLESTVLKLFPSLSYFKTMASEKLDFRDESTNWKAVILFYEDSYQGGFIIEEEPDLITFYVMKGTTLNDGEVHIIPREKVKFFEIPPSELVHRSRQYGKGFLSLIKQHSAELQ